MDPPPQPYRFSPSICWSISLTRDRTSSRSWRSALSSTPVPSASARRARSVSISRAHPVVVVGHLGPFRPQPIDYADQHLDFLFQPVDRLEIDRVRHDCFCHLLLSVFPRRALSSSASTIAAIAASTSSSVSVRSDERNVRRSDKLTRPSGTPFPWYRSNSAIDASVAGADDRIVPRTAAAGKASPIRIDRSRTIAGYFGSVSARRSSRACSRGDRIEVELGDVDLFARGKSARFGDRRRELSHDADSDSGAARSRRHGRARGKPDSSGVNSICPTPSALHRSSTTPLTSKKSTPRPAADQCGCSPGTGPGECRRALLSVAGEAAANLEQPDVLQSAAPIVGAGLDQSRAAARGEARRTSRRAGWRSPPVRHRRRRRAALPVAR